MVGAPSQPNSVTGHRRPVKAKPLRGGWLGAYRFIVAQASTKSDLENTGSRIFFFAGTADILFLLALYTLVYESILSSSLLHLS